MKHITIIILFSLAGISSSSAEDSLRSEPRPSAPISLIIGHADQLDYFNRVTAVRKLGHHLADHEIESLMSFLGTHPDDDPLPLQPLNAIKNDIVNKLVRQERPVPGLTRLLIESFGNPAMDNVWRDYSLQHLGSLFRHLASPDERRTILDTLWGATHSTESTFAGTSLLALANIRRGLPEAVDVQELELRAFTIAHDQAMPLPSRIASIQLSGLSVETLTLARSIAGDPQADILLRAASLPVLGQSDLPSDQAALREFANSSDIRLRGAARAALAR